MLMSLFRVFGAHYQTNMTEMKSQNCNCGDLTTQTKPLDVISLRPVSL